MALPEADVAILGDVAEHLSADEAQRLWQRAGATARKAVYLSIPIVHYPQGEIEGNPTSITWSRTGGARFGARGLLGHRRVVAGPRGGRL